MIDLKMILAQTVSGGYGDLVTRRTGAAVRDGVEQELAQYEGHEVAIIDFSGVRLMDLSCADEIVAKLLLTHGRGRYFLFCGVSEGHQEALEPVLERHGLAAATQDRAGRLQILGSISDQVRSVFGLVAENGSAELEDIAMHLEVPEATAQMAMDELLDRRLALAGTAVGRVTSLA